MSFTDLRPIPPRPNLEQYKKQAKDLLAGYRARDPLAIDRFARFHQGTGQNVALTDAQLVIAREHGFASWPKFAGHIEELVRANSPAAAFEAAADAIASGDVGLLEDLLSRAPDLVRERSARSHGAMLLHYTASNGVEDYRQKTPPNIVQIASALLGAGAEVDAIAAIYGGSTTLSLAASSVHPQRAGVQIPLLNVLLENGAAIDGVTGGANPILSALHNGRDEAARFLADKGACLDLESAAGTGRIEEVRAIAGPKSAATGRGRAALAWACEYGHVQVVDFLLNNAGGDPNAAHHGQTPLHWAAMNAQAEVVRLLLKLGASADALNQYNATPFGQARWSAGHDDRPQRFEPVFALLGDAESK